MGSGGEIAKTLLFGYAGAKTADKVGDIIAPASTTAAVTAAPTSTAQADLDAAQKVASERAAAAHESRARAVARSRSVYTSPLGLSDQATTASKTLLGN